MTIVGISFGTLVAIAFWGWVAGVVTGAALILWSVAGINKLRKKDKE